MAKKIFDVNTPPHMYHPVPVPKQPLPTNTDVEELQQALNEGVNVVKDSICKSVPGNCQLQEGRKQKQKKEQKINIKNKRSCPNHIKIILKLNLLYISYN